MWRWVTENSYRGIVEGGGTLLGAEWLDKKKEKKKRFGAGVDVDVGVRKDENRIVAGNRIVAI